mmetsp:Transcript_15847/g.36690  ORF Transcript_15847/g.36690 Transcript_15847/m.36690 type:complete len:663 (-) Transcript_15847:135-2123(-)|eukprot:CAMPEP_0197185260 /NCGR_PEP_ID=MMETSP1423-20130617/11555_1 /TAXON_ID=476441 /ORGANISM="Pseudo-nitzschia heimii, Strain UNC1101" /LENGTH=662 /DNA_ID=CAMNT_0042636281 /DNA_START=61 /DNA_END=2049 /DNA_ORIENTATION=-
MPTLMASQKASPMALPPQSASPHTISPAISLTIDGVDFKLCPANRISEVSYRMDKSDNVVLSLSSFTGTLVVAKAAASSLLCPSSTQQNKFDSTYSNAATIVTAAPTVEDDPDSPEQLQKKTRQKLSHGQQTLQFKADNKIIKKNPRKERGTVTDGTCKRRNADVSVKVPQEMKLKRKRNDIETPVPPISLGQSSQNTHLSQIECETNYRHDPDTIAPTDKPEIEIMNPLTGTPSVQDILDRDRIQSSEESIVTVKDGDEGDAIADVQDQEICNDPASNEEKSSFSYPAPPARWGHTMTQVDNGQILVYGGQSFDLDGNPVILSDVHVYDPKNGGSWHKPINCRGEARQWHSATFIPGRQQIIAFGGETIETIGGTSKKGKKRDKVITSDTLRVLDTEIMLWYPPAASGDVPTGRSGHTATFFPATNELILFGGVHGSKWLNSVSVLDVTRWIWTSPNIAGTVPKPRSYHSATAVGPQKLVVFGGNNKTSCFNTVHVLEAIGENNTSNTHDVNSKNSKSGGQNSSTGWKWSNPTIRGKAPFPRTGHTATLLEDGKTIIVYGGWDPNEEDEITGEDNIFKGSYLLDTQEWLWKRGPDPQPGGSGSGNHVVESCGAKRCGHTAALNPENGEVFIFGGRIPGESLAGDVQRIVPPQEKAVELDQY